MIPCLVSLRDGHSRDSILFTRCGIIWVIIIVIWVVIAERVVQFWVEVKVYGIVQRVFSQVSHYAPISWVPRVKVPPHVLRYSFKVKVLYYIVLEIHTSAISKKRPREFKKLMDLLIRNDIGSLVDPLRSSLMFILVFVQVHSFSRLALFKVHQLSVKIIFS